MATAKKYRDAPRGSSQYRGLSLVHQSGVRQGCFHVQQIVDGENVAGGLWVDERMAALASDRLRLHFGLEPWNFPGVARQAGAASPETLKEEAASAFFSVRHDGSRFRGCFREHKGQWRALGWFEEEMVFLGNYNHEDDAALAYDRAARHFGVMENVNFECDIEPHSPFELRKRAEKIRRKPHGSTGMEKDPASGRWRASVVVSRGKSFRLLDVGTWDREIEAARARDRAALHYAGKNAQLNLERERKKLIPSRAAELRKEADAQMKRSMTKARRWMDGRHEYICYLGKVRSIPGWGKELGLSHQGMRLRIAQGLSIEEVVSCPRKPARRPSKFYRYRGRSQSIADWSQEVGLSGAVLYSRVTDLGWSFAKAVETPLRKKAKAGKSRRSGKANKR
jgi:hypothetical protein